MKIILFFKNSWKRIIFSLFILIAVIAIRIYTIITEKIEVNWQIKEKREKGYKLFSSAEKRLSESPITWEQAQELRKQIKNNKNNSKNKEQKKKVFNKNSWREIKFKRELIEGKTIKPIQRKKSLKIKIDKCRECDAPKEYLGLFGKYPQIITGKKYQKIYCQICKAQYAPEIGYQKTKTIDRYCPYCGKRIDLKKKRKSGFNILKCVNSNCPFKNGRTKEIRKINPNGYRYTYREYNFGENELQIASPNESKINWSQIRTSPQIIDTALTIRTVVGSSLRETSQIMKQLFQVKVNYESIRVWEESLANLLCPLYQEVWKQGKISLSGKNVFDETYVRYKGKWGYVFVCMDAIKKIIISLHFSAKRNAQAATCIAKNVDEKLKNQEIKEYTNIRDGAPIYAIAFDWIKINLKSKIHDIVIKGIFDEDKNNPDPNRKFKQVIERYNSTYKRSGYKKGKSFNSFNGAVVYSFLHMLYYNHLRPHESFNNLPPAPLYLKNKKMVEAWPELIQYLIEINQNKEIGRI